MMQTRTVESRSHAALRPLPVVGLRGVLQRKCACGGSHARGECEECRKKWQGLLQQRALGPEPNEVPPIVYEVLRSPGRPLDAETRAFMEPRFGHDFSKVRIHTDARAAESARAVNALAYTVGRDIVCQNAQYAPGTETGNRLLAHELTHVVQQQEANFGSLKIGSNHSGPEREARETANALSPAGVPSQPPLHQVRPVLQRSIDSSGSGSGSMSSANSDRDGGTNPVPGPDERSRCRIDICWRPVQAYWGIVGALGFNHGFINMIDSRGETHNLYVDPSLHNARGTSHSHAVDSSPGWDTSGTTCYDLSKMDPIITCPQIDRLPDATKRYENLDVAYDARSGPNSNSFLEWILSESGLKISGLPSSLKAWDYYQKNPGKRSAPPRVNRTAATAPTIPAGGGVAP